MVMKLRKEGKTIWHISIVLMMMLLVVFLVAPASAVNCRDAYSPYEKKIDKQEWQTYDRVVFSYNVPAISKKILVWVKYGRSVTTWHQERTKYHKEYCNTNQECEIIDQEIQKRPQRMSYGRYSPVDVWHQYLT